MKYDTAAGTSWKGYPFKTLQEAKVSCEAIGTRLATIVELEDAFAESVAQHSATTLRRQCEEQPRSDAAVAADAADA